jgi:two-component system CheB/CheR fusion protein
MRLRKYLMSERAASSKSLASAHVVSLDAADDRSSKISEAGGLAEDPRFAPASRLSARKSHESDRAEIDNKRQLKSSKRRHLTAADLQKLLYSTDVAKVLLDIDLTIRFFTPAAKLMFNITLDDIGRSFRELDSPASCGMLMEDARKVLRTTETIEREIEARSGAWYLCRILPYRYEGKKIEGIVITFADISHQMESAAALEGARVLADSANAAKSRFLAAASHDLRQPLQTLVLLQELLAKVVVGEKAKKLVNRLDNTLGGMAGMLNALLDINQIEAGTVRAELQTFRIDAVLDRVAAELCYQAEAQRIAMRVSPCTISVRSDPRLLEQMIRNLVSNALKYTRQGRVLIGCRRRGETLIIEIWDTGAGIPENQLQDIFDEYHQLDNVARDRTLGLGLGLSIVRRLGVLLDHPVTVRSQVGKGSVFSIQVRQSPGGAQVLALEKAYRFGKKHHNVTEPRTILIIEDDSEVRDLLQLGLSEEGHTIVTANDGVEALEIFERGGLQPALIISDFNLPNGMDGLAVAAELRARLHRSVPVIILTGDISTKTLRDIFVQKCEHLNKPASLNELTAAIERFVPVAAFPHDVPAPVSTAPATASVIYVVDDDHDLRQAVRDVLEDAGHLVEDYQDGEAFLNAYRPGCNSLLLIDANLPGICGLDLLKRLKSAGHSVPAIMITGQSDVPMAVDAMKAGAADFLEKPIHGVELLASVRRTLESFHDSGKLTEWCKDAADHLARLTGRQREIMEMVLAGHPSKNIASDLGISQRTVENHRASIMKKAGVRSLPALARLALAAAGTLMTDQSLATIS